MYVFHFPISGGRGTGKELIQIADVRLLKHQRDKQIIIVYLAGVKRFRLKEAY